MRTINDGGTAFPMQDPQAIHAYASEKCASIADPEERDRVYTTARREAVGGLAKREYFACMAMQAFLTGHINHYGHESHWHYEQLASEAFDMADAMLAASKKGEEA